MTNPLIRLDDGTWVDPLAIRSVAAYCSEADEWPPHVRVTTAQMMIHINYETFREAETARDKLADEVNRVRKGKK